MMLMIITMASYGQNGTLTVEQVFNKASFIDGFKKVEYTPDNIKFPKEIGVPEMIIHGNAEPRNAVLALLSQLSEDTLVYDNTDERGKFDRMFLDKNTNYLLYVHIGFGGNDSVLIIFRGADNSEIEQFLKNL